MTLPARLGTVQPPCCVCGADDRRSLADVALTGGATVTLCGSHAVMHRRVAPNASSGEELRRLLRDRRRRRDRREPHDELAQALTAAFVAEPQPRQRDRRATTGRMSGAR